MTKQIQIYSLAENPTLEDSLQQLKAHKIEYQLNTYQLNDENYKATCLKNPHPVTETTVTLVASGFYIGDDSTLPNLLETGMLELLLFSSAPATAEDVLKFWFGTFDSHGRSSNSSIWFKKSKEFDQKIKRKFALTVHLLSLGSLDWSKTSSGRLAEIICLDQFPRNMFRGTPQAFHYDPKALQLALEGINLNQYQSLSWVPEKVFFALPLEHSENIVHQNMMVNLMRQLVTTAPQESQEMAKTYLEYAIAHQKIIERFGRFPHRNTILRRYNTPEEEAFLKEPGSSF